MIIHLSVIYLLLFQADDETPIQYPDSPRLSAADLEVTTSRRQSHCLFGLCLFLNCRVSTSIIQNDYSLSLQLLNRMLHLSNRLYSLQVSPDSTRKCLSCIHEGFYCIYSIHTLDICTQNATLMNVFQSRLRLISLLPSTQTFI